MVASQHALIVQQATLVREQTAIMHQREAELSRAISMVRDLRRQLASFTSVVDRHLAIADHFSPDRAALPAAFR